MMALRRRLEPLLPAVADVCGVRSVQFRLLFRALETPLPDPEAAVQSLRLAAFALDEAPPWAQRAIAGWPSDAWRRGWDADA